MVTMLAKDLPVGVHFGWQPPGDIEFTDSNEKNGVVISNTSQGVVVQFGGWIGQHTFLPDEPVETTWIGLTDEQSPSFGRRYARFLGAIAELPDLADQHEHYRLGTPKR